MGGYIKAYQILCHHEFMLLILLTVESDLQKILLFLNIKMLLLLNIFLLNYYSLFLILIPIKMLHNANLYPPPPPNNVS